MYDVPAPVAVVSFAMSHPFQRIVHCILSYFNCGQAERRNTSAVADAADTSVSDVTENFSHLSVVSNDGSSYGDGGSLYEPSQTSQYNTDVSAASTDADGASVGDSDDDSQLTEIYEQESNRPCDSLAATDSSLVSKHANATDHSKDCVDLDDNAAEASCLSGDEHRTDEGQQQRTNSISGRCVCTDDVTDARVNTAGNGQAAQLATPPSARQHSVDHICNSLLVSKKINSAGNILFNDSNKHSWSVSFGLDQSREVTCHDCLHRRQVF